MEIFTVIFVCIILWCVISAVLYWLNNIETDDDFYEDTNEEDDDWWRGDEHGKA